MRIPSKILKKYKLSMLEYLFLNMLSYEPALNPPIDIKSLLERGYVLYDGMYESSITNAGITLLKAIDSDLKAVGGPPDEEIIEMVEVMRSLFPEGKKVGTNKYWRDNRANIFKKLKVFLSENAHVTKEDVVKATEKYVDSFKNDKTLMRILPYFIEKNGESELLSIVENIDNVEINSNDEMWTSTLM